MTTTVHRILQLLRRSRRAARARARRGAARSRRAARRRHVGARDQPPLEDLRGHPREDRGRTCARSATCPPNYKVLFLQGGASLQFSMVPLNLLTAGATADYIVTGGWAQKAVKEAQRVGTVNIAASTESENFARIPRQDELKLTPNAAYVHITTNNTLFGTEWTAEPAVGDVPLVADTSSDMFSRPIDVVEVRADLRRRAEEPRAVRRDAGDHPRGSAGALVEVAAHDAELRRARRERLDVQHAAVLRHLPDGPGDEVGAGRRAASTAIGAAQRAQGREALRRDRSHAASIAAPRRRTAAR